MLIHQINIHKEAPILNYKQTPSLSVIFRWHYIHIHIHNEHDYFHTKSALSHYSTNTNIAER